MVRRRWVTPRRRWTLPLSGMALAGVLAGVVVTIAVLALTSDDGQAGDSESILVTRVIDGDTIVVADGRHIRLIGVDTPETVHPTKPVGCYGPEASAFNKKLLEGKQVTLERDKEEHDVYDRPLRYVYLDGQDVQALLIAQGYGRADNFPPNTKHRAEYMALQKEAKAAKRGLWGEPCNGKV